MGEEGKGKSELVAVEGPVWLAYDDGVKAAIRVSEGGE